MSNEAIGILNILEGNWSSAISLITLVCSLIAALAGFFVFERRRPNIAIDNSGFTRNPYYLDMSITNMSDLTLHIEKAELFRKDIGLIEIYTIQDRSSSRTIHFLSPHNNVPIRLGLLIDDRKYNLLNLDDRKEKLSVIFYFKGRIWPNNKRRIIFSAY